MTFALDLSQDAKRWLREEPDSALVNHVTGWIERVLCDDASDIHDSAQMVPLILPGLPMGTVQVPDTDLAVTFFEARPFRTIKVMRIERIQDYLDEGQDT